MSSFVRNQKLPIYKSNYADLVDSKHIVSLEKTVRDDKGFPDSMALRCHAQKVTVGGLNCVIFRKGTLLFKATAGFLYDAQINEYCKKCPEKNTFFGSEVIAYAYSRVSYFIPHVFRVMEDVILVDYFDMENMNKIAKYMKPHNAKYMKVCASLDITDPEDQKRNMKFIHGKEYATNYEYTKPMISGYSYQTVPKHPDFVSPISSGYLSPVIEADFCQQIREHFDARIDGMWRPVLFAPLESNGSTMIEEVAIQNTKMHKIQIADDHPFHWTNICFPFDMQKFAGRQLCGVTLRKISWVTQIMSNENFALMKFAGCGDEHNDVINVINKLPKGFRCLSWNIGIGRNIFGENNYDHVRKIINEMSPDFVALQEVPTDMPADLLHDSKCDIQACKWHTEYVANGSSKTGIRIFSKHEIKTNVIPMISKKFIMKLFAKYKLEPHRICCHPRNNIIVHVRVSQDETRQQDDVQDMHDDVQLSIACVHLNIGKRPIVAAPYDVANENSKIAKFNSELRYTELKNIVRKKPDVIMGDFNCTIDDAEMGILKRDYMQLSDGKRSTPHNRVDHIYYRKKMSIAGITKTLKFVESDHLPIVQTFKCQK